MIFRNMQGLNERSRELAKILREKGRCLDHVTTAKQSDFFSNVQVLPDFGKLHEA